MVMPARSRPNTSAGFGHINSSAGWSWGRSAGLDTHVLVGTAGGDLGGGGEMGWPLRNDLSQGIRRTDNVIEEIIPEGTRIYQDSRYFTGGV